MAEGTQTIDTIGVSLALDTSNFDSGLTKARSQLAAFESSRTRALSVPKAVTITPQFQVNQSSMRSLKIDMNEQLSKMAARNEAVAIPVKLGQSDWAGMRSTISQKIGEVPIKVTLSGNLNGLRGQAKGLAGSSGGSTTDLLRVVEAFVAYSQNTSLTGAAMQMRKAAATKGVKTIPGMAHGGPVGSGQIRLVGEEGPEIVQFQRPAQVYRSGTRPRQFPRGVPTQATLASAAMMAGGYSGSAMAGRYSGEDDWIDTTPQPVRPNHPGDVHTSVRFMVRGEMEPRFLSGPTSVVQQQVMALMQEHGRDNVFPYTPPREGRVGPSGHRTISPHMRRAFGGPAHLGRDKIWRQALAPGYRMEFIKGAFNRSRVRGRFDAQDMYDNGGTKRLEVRVTDRRGFIAGEAPMDLMSGDEINQMGFRSSDYENRANPDRLYWHPVMTEVNPEHQGKKISNAMYHALEHLSGVQVAPGDTQLPSGIALWSQPPDSRPFGRDFGNQLSFRSTVPTAATIEREMARQSQFGQHAFISGWNSTLQCAVCSGVEQHSSHLRGLRPGSPLHGPGLSVTQPRSLILPPRPSMLPRDINTMRWRDRPEPTMDDMIGTMRGDDPDAFLYSRVPKGNRLRLLLQGQRTRHGKFWTPRANSVLDPDPDGEVMPDPTALLRLQRAAFDLAHNDPNRISPFVAHGRGWLSHRGTVDREWIETLTRGAGWQPLDSEIRPRAFGGPATTGKATYNPGLGAMFRDAKGKRMSAPDYFALPVHDREETPDEALAFARHVAAMRSASPDEVDAGTKWYAINRAIHEMLGKQYNQTPERMLATSGTMSPRAAYPNEVLGAEEILKGTTTPQISKMLSLLGGNVDRARLVLAGGPHTGRKVSDYIGSSVSAALDPKKQQPEHRFYANDAWQLRVTRGEWDNDRATDSQWWASRTGGLRGAISIEDEFGLTPFQQQATTWVAARNQWLYGNDGYLGHKANRGHIARESGQVAEWEDLKRRARAAGIIFPRAFGGPSWRGKTADAYRATLASIAADPNNAGGTFPHQAGWDDPKRGWAVGIPPVGRSAAIVHPDNPEAFLRAFRHVRKMAKAQNSPYVGTWFNPETGLVEIDPSTVIGSKREADLVGRAYGQTGIYGLGQRGGYSDVTSTKTRMGPLTPRIQELVGMNRYKSPAEMVPVSILRQLMTEDREHFPKVGQGATSLDDVTRDVAAHGVHYPLSLLYEQGTGRVGIGDGNHRLAAALRLGLKHLPAEVKIGSDRVNPKWLKQQIISRKPLTGRQAGEWVSPSEIGLSRRTKFRMFGGPAGKGIAPGYSLRLLEGMYDVHSHGYPIPITGREQDADFNDDPQNWPEHITPVGIFQDRIVATQPVSLMTKAQWESSFAQTPSGSRKSHFAEYEGTAQDPLYWHPHYTHTLPDHQKKGLASNMYAMLEQQSGIQLSPAGTQLRNGTQLWNMNDRPFGRHFGRQLWNNYNPIRDADGNLIPNWHPQTAPIGWDESFRGPQPQAGLPRGGSLNDPLPMSRLRHSMRDIGPYAGSPLLHNLRTVGGEMSRSEADDYFGWNDPDNLSGSTAREVYHHRQRERFYTFKTLDRIERMARYQSGTPAGVLWTPNHSYLAERAANYSADTGYPMDELGILATSAPSLFSRDVHLLNGGERRHLPQLRRPSLPGWVEARGPMDPSIVDVLTADNRFQRLDRLRNRAFGGSVGRDFVGAPLPKSILDPMTLRSLAGAALSESRDPEMARFWNALMDPRRGPSFDKKKILPHASGGSESGQQTYLVGELAPELFVPNRSLGIVPQQVMDKIPKRAQGGETRQMGAGVVEVGTRGPHLFTPSEDGWIIPHNLVGEVYPNIPRAKGGRGMRLSKDEIEALRTRMGEVSQSDIDSLVGEQSQILEMVASGNIGALQAMSGRTMSSFLTSMATSGSRSGFMQKQHAASIAGMEARRTARREAVPALIGMQSEQRIEQAQGVKTRAEAEIVKATAMQDKRIAAGTSGSKAFALTEGRLQRLAKTVEVADKAMEHHRKVVDENRGSMDRIKAANERYAKLSAEAQPGFGSKAAMGLQVFGANAAYGLAMQGVSAAVSAATPQVEKWVDSVLGFTAANQRVTKGVGDMLRQNGGNAFAAFGQMAQASGMSGDSAAFLEERLAGSSFAKAGASAQVEKSEMFKAAANTNAPTGLIGGYGGLFGSSFLGEMMGGGKGYAEQIGLDVKDLKAKSMPSQIVTGANGQVMPATGYGSADYFTGLMPSFKKMVVDGGGKVEDAPLTPEQQAASDSLNAYTLDLSATMARGAKALGQSASKFVEIDDSMDEIDLAKFKALGTEAADMVAGGRVLTDATGKVITDLKKYQEALQQGATGSAIGDPLAYARQQARGLLAEDKAAQQTTAYQERRVESAYGEQLAAQPFMAASTGISTMGLGGKDKRMVESRIGKAQSAQSGLMEAGDAAIAEQVAWMRTLEQGNPILAGTADKYKTLMDQVSSSGDTIVKFQTKISDIQLGLAESQYSNNMRLANRAVSDALGLAGRAGGRNNLGAIQREQTTLGFALNQKQINFQVAMAGFQAPGLTSEERAARQEEARIEAKYAQRQLNLSKRAFSVSADRGVTDTTASRNLLKEEWATQQKVAAVTKQMAAEQARQSKLLSTAALQVNKAEGSFSRQVASATTYVSTFGGSLKDATDALRKALGMEAVNWGGPKRGQSTRASTRSAAGFYGAVQGATEMTVGEAGTETVAVLRNPRTMMAGGFGGGGGGGGQTIVNLNLTVQGDVKDDATVAKITRAVEDLFNRKAARLGMRSLVSASG